MGNETLDDASVAARAIAFEQDKLAALRSLDIDKIVAFRRRWGLECPDVDRDWYLIGAHRARVNCAGLTWSERTYSASWLLERGYSTDRDQVFALPLRNGTQ